MKKSMFLLLTLWIAWTLIINNFNVMQEYAQIQTGVFVALVYWVFRRPEWIPSDPPSDNTVQIAFYYGDKSPFIANVFSLLGFNVTGIAVIIGDVAMVPIGKSGKIEERTRGALKKWIKLDVGNLCHHCVTKDRPAGWKGVKYNFCRLSGAPVGYGGCMEAMKPIISRLPYWSPLDSPSSLMSKILNGKK